VSARTHIEPVYVPADVTVTQFGASCRVAKDVVVVPVFLSSAAQPPLWPPETRVRVTFVPDPDVFQPERSVSNPGFRTKFTFNDAVADFPAFVPVTVCGPPTVAVQVAPVHEPFGESVKVVPEVTSPSELLDASNPCAVYVCEPPEPIVADAGLSVRWSSAAALT
jgi:hypothetical protein